MYRLDSTVSERVVVSAAVILAIAHAFWVAEQFAYTGYWDDTLLLVGWLDYAPSGFFSYIPWALDQQGDLNGPLIYLTLLPGHLLGIQSNYLLVLIGNIALSFLILILGAIAVRLGIGLWAAVVSTLIFCFSHVFSDQRTWFVPIQHTLTVLFSVLAVLFMFRLLRAEISTVSLISGTLGLNFLLFLVALGRETALPLSVLVVGLLIWSRNSKALVLGISWIIPVIIQVQRTFSGRLGNRVEWFLEGVQLDAIRPSINLLAQSRPSTFVAMFVPALVVGQILLLPRVNHSRGVTEALTRAPRHIFQLPKRLRVVTLGLWGICLTFPHVGTPFLGSVPPFHLLASTTVERWQISRFSMPTYLVGISISFIALTRKSVPPWLNLLSVTTFLLTLPYLIGQYESTFVDGSMGATSVSRYSIYFLPLAFLAFASLLQGLVGALRSKRAAWSILCAGLALLVVTSATLSTQSVQRRSELYRSVNFIRCSEESYFMPSVAFERFRQGYLSLYVRDPLITLLDDSRIKRVLLTAPIRRYTDSVDLNTLDQSCTYPVEWLLEVLGPSFYGEAQQKLDEFRSRIGLVAESQLRDEVWQLLESNTGN